MPLGLGRSDSKSERVSFPFTSQTKEQKYFLFFFQFCIYLHLQPGRTYKGATATVAKFIDRMCRAADGVDRGRAANHYLLLNMNANFVRNELAGIKFSENKTFSAPVGI